MFTTILVISVLMLFYGLIRIGIAMYRHESNVIVHALWIPGAAFVFALAIGLVSWISAL